jgi:hypothetical protein
MTAAQSNLQWQGCHKNLMKPEQQSPQTLAEPAYSAGGTGFSYEKDMIPGFMGCAFV